MSQVDVEVVEDIGPDSSEERIQDAEKKALDGINVLEFFLNEVGYKIQRSISKLIWGESSFDEERMDSLEPDVQAIKDHMEDLSDAESME